jgi:hypothetical protein
MLTSDNLDMWRHDLYMSGAALMGEGRVQEDGGVVTTAIYHFSS